ncbi:MAG TPA: MMPL family transporter [Streptosporangiaceae bacterium]|nr:MMPL family transporter [Streptosporangiaceae bacterium]
MSFIARWCFRHRFAVITAWVLALIALGVLAQAVKSEYDNSFSLPGTGSTTAQQLLAGTVPAQSGDSDRIVWHVGTGTVRDAAVMTRMTAALTRIATFPEVASVISPYGPRGTAQISRDDRTAYAVVNFTKQSGNLAPADVDRVINAAQAAREPGLDVQLGGQAIEKQPPLSFGTVVGVLAAAIVLFIAFGSLLATLLPLITALAGVGAGLMAIAPLTHSMSVVVIAPIIASLIGLGVGIDYALFIVTRYRRGLEAGLTPEEATVTALNTSGRTVLFASGTVCIALLGILVLNFGFLNGLAVACALTVVLTVVATVTMLPALLSLFGHRVLSRRQRRRLGALGTQPGPAVGPEPTAAGAWVRWADIVQRRPAVLAAVAVAVMVVLALPVSRLQFGTSDQGHDPASTTTRQAYDLLAQGFGPGFNGPLVLVAQASSPADAAALQALEARLPRLADVASVAADAAASGTTVIQLTPRTSPDAPATTALITSLRTTTIPAAEQGTTLRVYVGGQSATNADFTSAVKAKLPWFLLTIIGLSFLLLVIAFRSLLIPATAAVMNLLTAAATFGVMTALFQWGWGLRTFGLGTAGPVESFLPVLILPILYGLSTDYQVFLVSRMGEEWARCGDSHRAVRAGQVGTARIITAAAAIMICVFLAFSLMSQRTIAEFGISLTIAVALDAFVVRTVLVPAIMHLSGAASWLLPRWLDRRLPHLAIEPAQQALANAG